MIYLFMCYVMHRVPVILHGRGGEQFECWARRRRDGVLVARADNVPRYLYPDGSVRHRDTAWVKIDRWEPGW